MDIDEPHQTIKTATAPAEATFKTTISKQPFYYFAVELITSSSGPASEIDIDAQKFHSYMTAVLAQWLGAVGSGMSLDILSYTAPRAIVRVPYCKYKGVWQAMTVNSFKLMNGATARFSVVRGSAFYMGVVASSRTMF
ncbi:hypothetical protein LPJ66_003391 [Kickxella alabastrina]|uniref:Uncharacterized protein n=1 Tax=Kickxella alabastrina TaxID=61397 RepID=A0ACC1IJW5_9FUNG|nr:hypothetical protein LPJ66_003391 [Kickxella alabastrina]